MREERKDDLCFERLHALAAECLVDIAVMRCLDALSREDLGVVGRQAASLDRVSALERSHSTFKAVAALQCRKGVVGIDGHALRHLFDIDDALHLARLAVVKGFDRRPEMRGMRDDGDTACCRR